MAKQHEIDITTSTTQKMSPNNNDQGHLVNGITGPSSTSRFIVNTPASYSSGGSQRRSCQRCNKLKKGVCDIFYDIRSFLAHYQFSVSLFLIRRHARGAKTAEPSVFVRNSSKRASMQFRSLVLTSIQRMFDTMPPGQINLRRSEL